MRLPPLLLLLAFCLPPSAHPSDPVNTFLGTQAIGGRYHFTEDEPLLESAKRIAELGAGTMKFSISREASFGDPKANVRKNAQNLQTLAAVAAQEPGHRAVLDLPFTHFFLWTYPFTTHGSAGTFDPGERDLEYREMRDLAEHLLRTYSGSGKRFYLGHWEGDWHLRPHFDPKQPIPEPYRDHFIAWLRIRQQAIDDAKQNTRHENVEVWHYTEVNLVEPFLKGGSCLTNDVLPAVDVDFVSYSCYDSLQGNIRDDLFAALNHIESKLKPKPGIRGKRVFLGEYGFPARRYTPEEQNRKSIEVMITAIEWGCPFVLYWQLYDNEGTNEKPGGFWLIDQHNQEQPIWRTHQHYFQWAKQHLDSARQRTGQLPTDAEFRAAALAYLRRL
ncbi:MAG: hypothetical protein DVB23_000250 [Verrucomicrobia bacterium]|nr:MAG: hypothetical protein DVB23_000250 [Verrucomicrobiota bacterium]